MDLLEQRIRAIATEMNYTVVNCDTFTTDARVIVIDMAMKLTTSKKKTILFTRNPRAIATAALATHGGAAKIVRVHADRALIYIKDNFHVLLDVTTDRKLKAIIRSGGDTSYECVICMDSTGNDTALTCPTCECLMCAACFKKLGLHKKCPLCRSNLL